MIKGNPLRDLRRPGKIKPPRIAKSPRALPVSPKNQKIKRDYCRRVLAVIDKWITEGVAYSGNLDATVLLFHDRISAINANKL